MFLLSKSNWYKAHVRQVMGGECLIHFDGWNVKHDRWVGLDSLRPINYEFELPEVMADPEDLNESKESGDMPQTKRLVCGGLETCTSVGGRPRHLGHSADDSGEERIKLPLPKELKDFLVSDWEQITRAPRQYIPNAQNKNNE